MSVWNLKRRYSAVAVFSDDLERVVLIHKLRPDWQAGRANLPGGKVETEQDYINANVEDWQGTHEEACDEVYRRCAARELCEETGLDVAATALQLFCRLRFKTPEGEAAECCFFASRGDVDAARTMEAERVFWDQTDDVCTGVAECGSRPRRGSRPPTASARRTSTATCARCSGAASAPAQTRSSR